VDSKRVDRCQNPRKGDAEANRVGIERVMAVSESTRSASELKMSASEWPTFASIWPASAKMLITHATE